MLLHDINRLKKVFTFVMLCFFAILIISIIIIYNNKNYLYIENYSDTNSNVIEFAIKGEDISEARDICLALPSARYDYEIIINGSIEKSVDKHIYTELLPPLYHFLSSIEIRNEAEIQVIIKLNGKEDIFDRSLIHITTHENAYLYSILYTLPAIFFASFLSAVAIFLLSFFLALKENFRTMILCFTSLAFILKIVCNLLYYSRCESYIIFTGMSLELNYGLIYKASFLFTHLALLFTVEYFNYDSEPLFTGYKIIQRAVFAVIIITDIILPAYLPNVYIVITILLIALSFCSIIARCTINLFSKSISKSLNYAGAVILCICYALEITRVPQETASCFTFIGYFFFCMFILFNIIQEYIVIRFSLMRLTDSLEREVEKRTCELTELNLSLQNEIGARIKAEENLRKISSTDFLTGAFNRMEGQRYLDELFNIYERYGQIFSVVILDIDDFKKINDRFGHETGDKTLVSISLALQNVIRNSDMFARWGGEEFIVVMPNSTLQNAVNAAEKLRKVTEALVIDGSLSVTISLGAAEIMQNDDTHSITRRADENLYQAKHAGKNCVYPKLNT